ncbi:MAG: hypothetical protein LIP16_11415 [Clostridium sp.]|nr:hypothetical protein [Clostridium sp.]
MKMDSKRVDHLMIIIALGWLLVIIMTLGGQGFAAMYVSVIIISAHMLVGFSHNGMVDKRLFFYPFLGWLITFTAGIAGMQYFAFLYGDSRPDFLILGMHPSFFFELGFYWIAGILTLSAGLYKRRDLWLSEEDWSEFLSIVNSEEEEADEGE